MRAKMVLKFLIIALIFNAFGFSTAVYAAGGSANLIVSAVPGENEDEIDVKVSLRNNSGIASFTLDMAFDQTKVEPLSLTPGHLSLSGQITSTFTKPNVDLSAVSEIRAIWFSLDNVDADGLMYTIKFKIKPGATGDTAFTVTYPGPAFVGDLVGDDVNLDITNASFFLGSDEPEEPGEPEEPIDTTPFVTTIMTNTLAKQNNTISGDMVTKVKNNTAAPQNAVVMMCVYDANNKLMFTQKKSVVLNVGANSVAFNDIQVPNATAAGYTVKVYVWDSLGGLKPLATMKDAPVQ